TGHAHGDIVKVGHDEERLRSQLLGQRRNDAICTGRHEILANPIELDYRAGTVVPLLNTLTGTLRKGWRNRTQGIEKQDVEAIEIVGSEIERSGDQKLQPRWCVLALHGSRKIAGSFSDCLCYVDL